MPALALQILGFILLIAGLAMAANLLGIASAWVIVGVVVLIGLMIITVAARINGRR